LGDECGGSGKGVGETGVSPWRRAVSEASVENREVLKIKYLAEQAGEVFYFQAGKRGDSVELYL